MQDNNPQPIEACLMHQAATSTPLEI